MGTDDNGDGAARAVKLDTLILTYNRAADHLEIGGAVNSIDLMLDMIARAKRILEARWRLQQIQQMQQAAADAAIAQRVGLGRPRG